MCAHAGTIFTQVLTNDDDINFLWNAKNCLGAPGIDCTLGFKFEYGLDYSALYDACMSGDAVKARTVMQAMLAVVDPVLRHYGSMEEFTKVKMDYWQPHKPWSKRRHGDFHDPALFDHAKAGSGAPYTKAKA